MGIFNELWREMISFYELHWGKSQPGAVWLYECRR